MVTPKGVIGQKRSSETEIQFYMKIISCDPSINTMDHLSKFYQTRRKNPFAHKELIKQLELFTHYQCKILSSGQVAIKITANECMKYL